MIYNSSY